MDILITAVIAWTCIPEFTENGNIIYTDCGYREISTINLPCKTEFYFNRATQRKEEHRLCKNPEYFPEMKIHIINNNIG